MRNNPLSNIWKLKLVRAFFWMHFFAAVLIPFYTDWGGLKLTQVFFINSWFMFWNFALEVPTGAVADCLGRKASLICGCAMAALAALIYASCPNFYVFLLAEIVFAAAYTLHSGADEALAYDSLKAAGEESQAKAVISGMESFKLGGIIAATIAGGFIATKFGLRAPMMAYAIPALAALFVCLTLKEPPVSQPADRRSFKGYMELIRDGFAFFSKNRILLLLVFELSLTNAFAWGIIWLFQPLLEQAGLSVKYFGVVHALAAAGQIVLLSNIERAERLAGSKSRLLLGMAWLTGVAFISLAFLHSIVAVSIAIVAAFSFSLPRIPVFSAYMNKLIPSDKRATVLSLSSMCRTIAIVVVNPLIGLLADWSLSGVMLVLGCLITLAAFFSRIEERHLA